MNNTPESNTVKPVNEISELEFYKSAVTLFESALKQITITRGGHKCNKIANKVLAIYYGGRAAMVNRGNRLTSESSSTPDVKVPSEDEVNTNPYANGAFMGLGS